jgi:hypothetical protein
MDLAVVVVLALWAVVAVGCSWGRAARRVCCGRRGQSASGSPVLPIGLMDAVKVALAWLAAWRGRDSGRCMLRLRCPIALSAM